MVENSPAVRPAPYVGVPVTTAAGHACAHTPVQFDLPAESFSDMYSAMPSLFTRIFLPIVELSARATVGLAFDVAPPVVVVAAGGWVVSVLAVEFLLLLPQAASVMAASAPI